jgi:hypothetical protein
MDSVKLEKLRNKFRNMNTNYLQNRPHVVDLNKNIAWKDMSEYMKKKLVLDYLHSKGMYDETRETIGKFKFVNIKYSPQLKKIVDMKFEF